MPSSSPPPKRGARSRSVGRGMRVALVHPDLGLGGAERLVIDVALALQSAAHTPTIYTAFRDPARCFADVAPGRETVRVRVLRAPLPRAILGRAQALLAALRCCALALYVCLFARPDAAFVDIVSLPVVVFAAFRVPVIFYCHFPDKTLEETLRVQPKSTVRRAYRALVDTLEECALRCATAVVCNSRFTQGIYRATYPSLRVPSVMYPCVHIPDAAVQTEGSTQNGGRGNSGRPFFLSLNRFERKKNIPLAIDAFAAAMRMLGKEGRKDAAQLVVAGGFDARLQENVEHFEELVSLINAHGLQDRVLLQRNVSDKERMRLMSDAVAVVYTPQGEHFGIVPLESMASGTPVIAVNSGGPTETVVENVTGRLCAPTPQDFGQAMASLIRDPELASKLGTAGPQQVQENFSLPALGSAMNSTLKRCVGV